MIPLERVSGVNAEQAAFLAAVGVDSAEQLARADDRQLQRSLDRLGTRRGRATLVPSLVTVRLWIEAAREVAGMSSTDDIPEAISVDEIPEAVVEPTPNLPEAPPVKETPRLLPADAVGQTLRPAASDAPRAEPAVWKNLDRNRFQTMEEYAEGGRGIEPLKRNPNPVTDSDGPAKLNADGSLSRWHRRGVLYPFPGRAILGALVSLLWRLAFIASLIAMPAYIFVNPQDHPHKNTTIAVWAAALLLLAFLQVWVAAKVRCRVCGCQFFKSLRCSKNRKAHRFPLLGFVSCLCLHLLIFHWFRCMYCGTAIRLFGRKHAKQSET